MAMCVLGLGCAPPEENQKVGRYEEGRARIRGKAPGELRHDPTMLRKEGGNNPNRVIFGGVSYT
jgi:hypothetical protein